MYHLDDLTYLINRLRDKDDGCVWDKAQTFQSLTKHTIEEAFEVVEAIENEDYQNLSEELADLLLQIMLYSQIASERQMFNFAYIVDLLTSKLIRRHPHIFINGDLWTQEKSKQLTEEELKIQWQAIKEQEKSLKTEVVYKENVLLELLKEQSKQNLNEEQFTLLIKKLAEKNNLDLKKVKELL